MLATIAFVWALVTLSPMSFTAGLQRLIADAPDRFSQDLGPQQDAIGDLKISALNFTIAGLTQCRVTRNLKVANVSCDAYRGTDPASAQATFDEFESRLRAFAGGRGRFFIESFSLTTERATVASYFPSEAVDVTVTRHEAKDADSVVFKVALNPS